MKIFFGNQLFKIKKVIKQSCYLMLLLVLKVNGFFDITFLRAIGKPKFARKAVFLGALHVSKLKTFLKEQSL